ncbi:MAG: hypothetical protein WDM89_06875 [Rhizomicrobium sp.]
MRRRQNAQHMTTTIAAIRELQRLRKEADLSRSVALWQASKNVLEDVREDRERLAVNWQQSIDRDVLSPELTALWAGELRRNELRILRAAINADHANAARQLSALTLNTATAHRDAAEDAARKARRRNDEEKEEARLQHVTDGYARRKRGVL